MQQIKHSQHTQQEQSSANQPKTGSKELIAIFSEDGFTLDTNITSSRQIYVNDKLLTDYNIDPYRALLHLGFEDRSPLMAPSLTFLHVIASFFAGRLSKDPDIDITRCAKSLSEEEASYLLQSTPWSVGSEFINSTWIFSVWNKLSGALESELAGFDGSATQYLLAHNSQINVVGRVFFHLVENKSDSFPFAFLATYSRKAEQKNKAEHVPLQNALLEYRDNQELLLRLLSTVSRAADSSAFISELVESGELFSPLRFTAQEAYIFLREIPLYEECGIMCRMPDWWKRKNNSVKVSVTIGDKQPSQVGLDALLSFSAKLVVDGVEITRDELELLMSQVSGLSLLKGRWVEVDHEKLQAVLEAYDKAVAQSDQATLADALRMQMGLFGMGDLVGEGIVSVSNGTWLNAVMDGVKEGSKLQGQREKVALGKTFKATLRHYQQDGLDWLATMRSLGFGALLADDMGLGKTIQVLALLEHLRLKGEPKTLLILPASLIGNWCREIERFTPRLRYNVLHAKNLAFNIEQADLFITTYGMASRIEELKGHVWDLLILDEAQAIKTPGTKQTKAVKSIPSRHHIAMTGTPVENRLSDLWSIFDFLNAGLLGTPKEFSSYAAKIQSTGSYARLRKTLNPFILRRLKTDKAIINDLPDKVEMKTYAALSKKQIALYSALVKELEESLDSLEGIQRKGIVLASIMKFKQICNHPDQYLGQNVFEPNHSGKFEILSELCETIREKRERVLVFTQFREMCEPLGDYLEMLFGRRGLVLHGGTTPKKRTEMVERFNGSEYVPYMILSLKAGGVGLNLTAANHVIHFDRWWNPAVENQATDRAFRIGQKKNVLVHKLITTGTIEEKIDLMITDKLKLSEELIVSSGESWITEMSNRELLRLLTLEV